MKHCPICLRVVSEPGAHNSCPNDGAQLIESTEWAAGTIIRNKYRILEKIGEGGMGVVYKAEHLVLEEVRALKVMDPRLGKVVNMSWYAARAYARWAGKRLPSEAEWEFACRAGTFTPYWWGDSFDGMRVGSLGGSNDDWSRNAWGVAAMLGTVWEWNASIYRPYPYHPDDGREDPGGQDARVLRGGARSNNDRMKRCGNRNQLAPGTCSDLVGFRCVR